MTSFVALLLAMMAMEPEPFTRDVAIAEARQAGGSRASAGGERARSRGRRRRDLARREPRLPGEGPRVRPGPHGRLQGRAPGAARPASTSGSREAARSSAGPARLRVAVADLRSADRVQRLARADLAKRLGVALEAVRVEFVRPTTWPDERLGCPSSRGRSGTEGDPRLRGSALARGAPRSPTTPTTSAWSSANRPPTDGRKRRWRGAPARRDAVVEPSATRAGRRADRSRSCRPRSRRRPRSTCRAMGFVTTARSGALSVAPSVITFRSGSYRIRSRSLVGKRDQSRCHLRLKVA